MLEEAIVHFEKDGTLDNSFGKSGIDTLLIYDQDAIANSVVLQPDGKILVGGYNNSKFNKYTNASLIRLKSNGAFDSLFGTNGIDTLSYCRFCYSKINSIAIQNEHKIIVGGNISHGGLRSKFAVTRYISDFGLNNNVIATRLSDLRFYPNPGKDCLHISYTLSTPDNICITIYDMQGRLMHQSKVNVPNIPSNHIEKINISNLIAGIYLIQVTTSVETKTFKVVKE